MFSQENFREIFDAENRRGIDLARRYFPTLVEHTKRFSDKRAEIRELRSQAGELTAAAFARRLSALKAELERIKRVRSTAIDEALTGVSDRVRNPGFKLHLAPASGPKGKTIYRVKDSPEAFFVGKQLQRNIKHIYQVKQSSRAELATQVKLTLRTRFPLEFVRTDISAFYESIDRKVLLAGLNDDPLLSTTSKKFIRQILTAYSELSGSENGLPRGVGISAYLAEKYVRPIDDAVQRLEGLVLYCRYVDDIIAIFARPPVGDAPTSYLDAIASLIKSLNLNCNASKTKAFNMATAEHARFSYLGYRFRLSKGACRIWPSAAKAAKYRRRIERSFQEYDALVHIRPRHAYRELVARIKFLTGNTRLTNSKGGAATGSYYNNSLVTELSTFSRLDQILKSHIKRIDRSSLKKRLRKFTFIDGFTRRRYHNFSTLEMHSIVRAWRHG